MEQSQTRDVLSPSKSRSPKLRYRSIASVTNDDISDGASIVTSAYPQRVGLDNRGPGCKSSANRYLRSLIDGKCLTRGTSKVKFENNIHFM